MCPAKFWVSEFRNHTYYHCIEQHYTVSASSLIANQYENACYYNQLAGNNHLSKLSSRADISLTTWNSMI